MYRLHISAVHDCALNALTFRQQAPTQPWALPCSVASMHVALHHYLREVAPVVHKQSKTFQPRLLLLHALRNLSCRRSLYRAKMTQSLQRFQRYVGDAFLSYLDTIHSEMRRMRSTHCSPRYRDAKPLPPLTLYLRSPYETSHLVS